jgi:Zn-dependent protease
MRRFPVSPIFLLLVGVMAVGGVLAATAPLPLDSLGVQLTAGIVLLVLAGWGVSLCLHEFGHAITAYKGGDWSVRSKGYLTLDIRRYTDPVLSFVIPLVLLLIGAIPLPGGAVWVNRSALRSRLVSTLVSLAGPAMNLVLGVLLALLVRFVQMPYGLTAGLSFLALLQLLAFLLNILPIPGLDGFGALEPYLSYQARRVADQVRPWAPLALFALILGVPQLGQLFFDGGDALFTAAGGDTDWAKIGQLGFLFWR